AGFHVVLPRGPCSRVHRGDRAVSEPIGILAILGATATGKSALAVAVAERLGGEVISADAFAAYRGFDVGTAKPSAEERARVPHHLVDVKEPHEPFSAGEFASNARRIAEEILSRGRLPILCGGTGFYVHAFFEGLFEGPGRDEPLRAALTAVAGRRGVPFLVKMLSLLDPEGASRVLPNDAARAIRLLEILLLSGRRPTDLFRDRPGERWQRPAVKVLLTLPREALAARIEKRFEKTMKNALPAEVSRLLEAGVRPESPAFLAIGYRETVTRLEGRLSVSEWEEAVKRNTRRFAKRQESWFRRERNLLSIRADDPGLIDSVTRAARDLFADGKGRGR
ncbi:MAG TPA: tRNA (adenosine(37)-N6)-dimethylallyltransferase MiaA, partial [Thermoanaerobaculia bacterium]|nr:tRNA (adenosine(37)-N6)-dimethylallyltransferase MiaA [Thermoanaerobaculia bacterium]